MVYSHMKLTLQYFVFMLLHHMKGFTAKLDLCSYPVNLSRDEPGFRYICNFFSISFISDFNTYLEFATAVSTVLIMIVAETGRH